MVEYMYALFLNVFMLIGPRYPVEFKGIFDQEQGNKDKL